MLLTQQHRNILNAVAQFRQIEKYHGVMPTKHAFIYNDDDVDALVGEGLLEWAKFTYGCGKELKGLRLTVHGLRAQERASLPVKAAAPGSGEELAYEHLLILQDLYHFCRMPRYRRMMPEKKARSYATTDFEDLVNRGYILRVRLKAEGEQTFKGFVISSKGERALAATNMAQQ